MIRPPEALLSAAGSKALDEEASAEWGLDRYALVEAAGRACAEAFLKIGGGKARPLAVLAGKGNNAADALVMLRALILGGHAQPQDCFAVCAADPGAADPGGMAGPGKSPLSQAALALQKMGVALRAWDAGAAGLLAGAGAVIDGIAGTGIAGPLRGAALEMAAAANALRPRPLVVSIDMPSGNFDGWQPGMPIIAAHATLAIEPGKLCLYAPAARPYAGDIARVGGVFPPALADKYKEAELVEWEGAQAAIAPVARAAYKYERGLVEIRAGSAASCGAAHLAALGAQAAGAGLVRLVADPAVHALLAPRCSGIMAAPNGAEEGGRFAPAAGSASALLLGPGWGRGADRMRQLEACLPLEEQGVPLILDADAIALARGMAFHGNAILTPHPGEFADYAGIGKGGLLASPVPALRRYASEKKAHILFKGHVLYAASPDGRIGVIDGMNPALAAGGTGDVLAGFCAAIAARQKPFDGYACICAAASLLIRAAGESCLAGAFFDPAELAKAASGVAGRAWL